MHGSRDDFYKHVKVEAAFNDRSSRFFLYGHTHDPVIVPLDAVQSGGKTTLEQMYFNSGTWRRVHKMAEVDPDKHEFMSFSVMTYLAFYKDGERRGRPFETWTGSLGLADDSGNTDE